MRLEIGTLLSGPRSSDGLKERIVDEAMRIVRDYVGKRDPGEGDMLLNYVEVKSRGLVERVREGYMTEQAAALVAAKKLIESLGPILEPAAIEIAFKKANYFFGRELLDRPKSIEQIVAERLERLAHGGDPTASFWIAKARALAGTDLESLKQRAASRDAVDAWVYANSPDPPGNPCWEINKTLHPWSERAKALIGSIRAAAPTPQAFATEILNQSTNLRKTGNPDDLSIARILSHYYFEMLGRAKAAVYAATPDFGTADDAYLAAVKFMQGNPTAPPFLELPAGIPALGDIKGGHLSVWFGGKHVTRAQEIAKNNVELARKCSGDVSHQYYNLELSIATLRRSKDPADAMAAQMISKYLLAQKKVWVKQKMEELLLRPAATPSWDLTSHDVKLEDGVTALPPTDKKTWKHINEAWDRIKKIASTDVLNKVGPCSIRVKKGVRANCGGKTMTIDKGEDVKTIMHEFGHHMEDQGGLAPFLHVQRILHERATGPELQRVDAVDMRSEMSYSAEMPATGSYAAKYYSHGSTEMVSMGMEFFSNPKLAAELYLKDPEMFMTILAIARGQATVK